MLEEIPGILVRLRTVSIPLAGATPKRLRPPPLSEPGESKPRSGNAVIPRFHLLSYPLRSKSDWKHSDEDTENGVALNSMTCSKIILQLSTSSNLSTEFGTPMGSRCYVFKILVTLLFEGFCVTSCFLRSKSDCLSRKMGDEVTENGFALNS